MKYQQIYGPTMHHRLGAEMNMRRLEGSLSPEIVEAMYELKAPCSSTYEGREPCLICRDWEGLLDFADRRRDKSIEELKAEAIELYGSHL
jgi:hypothetical protein